ncbi:MAG TPA: DUF3857 domain-containing protein [Bacteroidales bacterium]|nr:DUF3857 domain-containing protein [Bacteroidales bacterium]
MKFGDLSSEDVSGKIYKPDPGADAYVISNIGIASLNYNNEFYVEFERDVRIKIINSNGFDYADIEIPYSSDDDLVAYRASTFNIKNGEKTETKIGKKSFIIERSTGYKNTLKFNFPDVHEGSIIEYSYILRMRGEAISSLVPWVFQASIPVQRTGLTVVYPGYFIFKTSLSGNALLIKPETASKQQNIGGEMTTVYTQRWSAMNVPAFRQEPYMKSINENLTKLTFELSSVNFPGSRKEEITPTFETLTEKLLERSDFGEAILKAATLKKNAVEITKGLNDDLSRVKAIHKYLSENILWDGEEDYTTSTNLKTVYYKEKGNNADINLILIAMLRSLNIKADPVILSTRSNGSINQLWAMMSQFNYVIANVTINGEQYLIDATDPLRAFNMLPFDCLNDKGRLISRYESRFVDLHNSEETSKFINVNLILSDNGEAAGNLVRRNRGFAALDIRKLIHLEGEEGYSDLLKYSFPGTDLTDIVLQNISERDSDMIENCRIRIPKAAPLTGDYMLFNPYFSFSQKNNPFSMPERKFPVDFGCPVNEKYSITLKIPPQYELGEKPEDIRLSIGKNDAEYVFNCSLKENTLIITSSLRITKTSFGTQEYAQLRNFFSNMLLSQTRMIVLKKKI